MTWFTYPPMVAIGADGALVREGVGQVYAESDTSGSTPLAITDPNGLTLSEVAINDLGLTRAFRVEDAPEVVWRSGSFVVPLSSPKGLRLAAEAAAAEAGLARQAAEQAQASAEQARNAINLPTGGIPGQFLGIDADGNRYWGVPAGGGGSGIANAPSVWPTVFPPSLHNHPMSQISDASALGRQILGALSGSDVRGLIGAGVGNGNSNLTLGSTATTAAPGNHAHAASAITVTPSGSLTATDVQAALVQLLALVGTGGGGGSVPSGVVVARMHNGSSYPARGTLPAGAVAIWVGPTQPSFGGSGAVAGTDFYLPTTS